MIGSYVLRVLHGAPKKGVKSTNWEELEKLQKVIYIMAYKHISEIYCLFHSVEPDWLELDLLL